MSSITKHKKTKYKLKEIYEGNTTLSILWMQWNNGSLINLWLSWTGTCRTVYSCYWVMIELTP